MKLEDLKKELIKKRLMLQSAAALDRGDEVLALAFYRAAKQLSY